jgi:hypothetical protein
VRSGDGGVKERRHKREEDMEQEENMQVGTWKMR